MKLLEYFLYLIIFLVPTYLIRFSVFGIPTNVLEVLVGIAFIWWMKENFQFPISNFQSIFNFQFSKHRDLFMMVSGVLLIFTGLLFGIFASPDTRTSLGVLKGWFLVPLAFFIVARSILDTKEKKQRALWSLTLSGVGVALIGFFYWVSGTLTFDGRLAAFYESPNMLAMYIAPSIIILFQALRPNTKNQRPKLQIKDKKIVFHFRFVVLLFGICVLVLLFTRSLGAFVGITSAALFYLFTVYWGKNGEKLGKIIVVSIILLGILLPFSSFFFDPWDMGRTSLASRFMIWQASIEMLKDNLFFGIGPGVFQETYLAYQKNFPPFLEWAVPHPHNMFLTTWLYAGLFGLIGFFFILSWFFQKLKPYILYPIPFLIIFYILIHGAIDNTLWRNDIAMMFWLAVALM